MKIRKKRSSLTLKQRDEQLELFNSWLWDMPNTLERLKTECQKKFKIN